MIRAIQVRPMQLTLAALLAALVLLCPRFAPAQNAQGTIVGHVVDPSGAAVVGAKVTIHSQAVNVDTTLATNSSATMWLPL